MLSVEDAVMGKRLSPGDAPMGGDGRCDDSGSTGDELARNAVIPPAELAL